MKIMVKFGDSIFVIHKYRFDGDNKKKFPQIQEKTDAVTSNKQPLNNKPQLQAVTN